MDGVALDECQHRWVHTSRCQALTAGVACCLPSCTQSLPDSSTARGGDGNIVVASFFWFASVGRSRRVFWKRSTRLGSQGRVPVGLAMGCVGWRVAFCGVVPGPTDMIGGFDSPTEKCCTHYPQRGCPTSAVIVWVFGDQGPRGNSKELQANTVCKTNAPMLLSVFMMKSQRTHHMGPVPLGWLRFFMHLMFVQPGLGG